MTFHLMSRATTCQSCKHTHTHTIKTKNITEHRTHGSSPKMRQVRKPTCSLEGLSLVLCQLPLLSKRIKTGRHPQNSALNRNCTTISLSASLPCNYQHNQIAEQSFSQSTHTARALLLHLVRLLRSAWAVPAFSLLWSLGCSSLGCILQHKLFSCSVKQSQEFKTSLKLELPQLWDSENHKIIEFFFF